MGGYLKVFVETPELIKKKGKKAERYSEFYYLVDKNKVTYHQAHNYDELYKWGGQIYDFYVNDFLKCVSHHKLAEKLIEVVNASGISPKEVKILEMGAGHGLVLKELRARGKNYKVSALDINKQAKAAHDSEFIKDKYEDYWLGRTSKNSDIRHQITKLNPDVLMLASLPVDEPDVVEDIRAAFQLLKSNTLIVMNVDRNIWDNPNSPLSQFIQEKRSINHLEILSKEPYIHRKLLDGSDFKSYMVVMQKQ